MKIISSVCLSFAHVHMGRVQSCRNICVIVYKSGLSRCGVNLYKPVTLNFALFASNSFLFANSSTRAMHQSFLTTDPPPTGIAGLICREMTFQVLPQCWACGITRIYTHGIYCYKEQVPAVQGCDGWKFIVFAISYSGGWGSGYRWLVHSR